MSAPGDDILQFAAEPGPATLAEAPAWKVLIVDDEPDVHDATRIALRNVEICGRPLRFLHAYSAAEATSLLVAHADIAVVLLDVVMEAERAGLDLVRRIREELKLSAPRIVLRTGQPGYAPEIEAIRDFDINDYRIKSELNRTRLYALMTSAIRAYAHLRRLEDDQAGFRRLLQMQADFLGEHRLAEAAETIVAAAAAFLDAPREGLFCTTRRNADGYPTLELVAAVGPAMRRSLPADGSLRGHPALTVIAEAFAHRRHAESAEGCALRLPSRSGNDFVVFIPGAPPLASRDAMLLELFARNAAAGADNISLLERLREVAFTDGLTGIPARAALAEDMDLRLRLASEGPLRLLLVDVDQFSELNETFGDRIGDALLREVAQRLCTHAGIGVRVARVANDTFGVVGPRDALDPDAWTDVFDAPFAVDGLEIGLSASLGVVDLDAAADSGGGAIKKGYSALKRAKQAGHRSVAHYSPAIGAEIKERTRLLHGLRAAFERRQLHLVYQPQLDAGSGRVVGIEALMRWTGDDGRPVPPSAFIPVAEQSGLIRDLGEWALRAALADAVVLADAGLGDLRVAVNVSMAQLLAEDFVAEVASALAATGVPADRLELEVTESVAMQAPDVVLPKLAALKALGVQIAIDDFGTGFSSLSSLDRLPADRLKIDRSFVNSLGQPGGGARIAEMVVELGRTLGLRVIAEGVETHAQRERLLQLGCHELQGYLFSAPLDREALAAWIQARD